MSYPVRPVPRQHPWHRFEDVIQGGFGLRCGDEGTKMKAKPSLPRSPAKPSTEQVVKDIRQQTRRHFSAEDKIHIALDRLRGEDSIAEPCRKESIGQNPYYTITPG